MNFLLPQNLISLLALFLSLVSLGILVWVVMKLRHLLAGGDGKSIESALKAQAETIEQLVKFKADSTEYLKFLDKRLKQKVSNVELLRFNPFPGDGTGGNNSFSTSLLNEEGSGVVISSIHTRERTNIFSKPLDNWQSQNELSTEEKEVVKRSKDKLAK